LETDDDVEEPEERRMLSIKRNIKRILTVTPINDEIAVDD